MVYAAWPWNRWWTCQIWESSEWTSSYIDVLNPLAVQHQHGKCQCLVGMFQYSWLMYHQNITFVWGHLPWQHVERITELHHRNPPTGSPRPGSISVGTRPRFKVSMAHFSYLLGTRLGCLWRIKHDETKHFMGIWLEMTRYDHRKLLGFHGWNGMKHHMNWFIGNW